jgi:hypothetical protein
MDENKSAQLALQHLVMTEDDAFNVSEYELFLNKFREKGFDFDLTFMNENKICDVPHNMIQAFNECLIELKFETDSNIFSILTQLSIHIVDPSKIKSYINSEVKMILIDELKESYPSIKKMYPITDDLF